MQMPARSSPTHRFLSRFRGLLCSLPWRDCLFALGAAFSAALVQPVGSTAPLALSAMAAAATCQTAPASFAYFGITAALCIRGVWGEWIAVSFLFALRLFLGALRRRLRPAAWCAAAAVFQCVSLLPGLRLTWYDAALALENTALAGGVALLFLAALRTFQSRDRIFTMGESCALVVSVAVVLCGLRTLDGYVIRPFETCITILCLLCGHFCGAGAGSVAGVSIGAILLLTQPVRPNMALLYGLCGLLSGLCRPLGRWGSVGAFLVGGLLGVALGQELFYIAPLYQLVLAAAVLLLLPERFVDKLRSRFDRELAPALLELSAQKSARDQAALSLLRVAALYDSVGSVMQSGQDDARRTARYLKAAGSALRDSALSLRAPSEIVPAPQRSFAEKLRSAGLHAREVHVCRCVEEYRVEMEITGCGGCACRAAAMLASDALHRDMMVFDAPCLSGGIVTNVFKPVLGQKCHVELRQKGKFGLLWGSCLTSAKEDQVCGDASLIRRLPDGSLLLAVADGMGQGETAAAAAGEALSRLETLLDSGLTPTSALRLLGDWVHLQGDETYTTLDLCLISEQNATATLYKLAAAPSLLLRAGKRQEFAGESLPLGILEDAAPAAVCVPLQKGDILLLLSDGVYDAIDWKNASEILSAAMTHAPQAFAELLVGVSAFTGAEKDDRTAIVLRVA